VILVSCRCCRGIVGLWRGNQSSRLSPRVTLPGVGGPALPSDGRLADVHSGIKNFGRPDQEPLRVHVRADPRVRRLHLVSRDGDECDARPVADDHEVGVTLFFVATTWMARLRSVQCFDADGRPLESHERA
jgi:hypothetical protein